MSRLSDLSGAPADIIQEILMNLPNKDLAAVSRTSNRLRDVVNDEWFWHRKALRDFRLPDAIHQFRSSGWKALYRGLLNPLVVTFGDDGNGRLGREVSGEEPAAAPAVVKDLKNVVQIACGGWFMIARTTKGELYFWGTMDPEPGFMWGYGLGGETPVGSGRRREGPGTTYRRPTQIEAFRDYNISLIACGRAHAMALTVEGQVLTWKDIHRPGLVNISALTRSKIHQIACGWDHNLALTLKGEIIVWRKDVLDLDGNIPLLLPSGGGYFVAACGGEGFSVGLTNSGDVYRFVDEYEEAQVILGLGYTHLTAAFRHFCAFKPGVVHIYSQEGTLRSYPTLQNHGIHQVSFGDWHFGALGDDGKMYTWGAPSGGALGHGFPLQSVDQPKIVTRLEGCYVFQIALAGWQSACLVVETGPEASWLALRNTKRKQEQHDEERTIEGEEAHDHNLSRGIQRRLLP